MTQASRSHHHTASLTIDGNICPFSWPIGAFLHWHHHDRIEYTSFAFRGTPHAPRQRRQGCQKNLSEIYKHSSLGPFSSSTNV